MHLLHLRAFWGRGVLALVAVGERSRALFKPVKGLYLLQRHGYA